MFNLATRLISAFKATVNQRTRKFVYDLGGARKRRTGRFPEVTVGGEP